MTLDECIDYAEKQSEWMSKYAMIDIYKDKSEYYRQLAKWLKDLKEYKDARVGCEYCKHHYREQHERPCSLCQRNFMDMFEREVNADD